MLVSRAQINSALIPVGKAEATMFLQHVRASFGCCKDDDFSKDNSRIGLSYVLECSSVHISRGMLCRQVCFKAFSVHFFSPIHQLLIYALGPHVLIYF